MAKKFKDYYNVSCARLIGEKLLSVYSSFAYDAFVAYIKKHVAGKTFHDRQDVFADAFEQFLTPSYEKNIGLFHKILGEELQQDTGMFIHGWWLWPVGRYVQRHGAKYPEVSLGFIYELTKRFTGEFAIRPIIAVYPKETLKTLQEWSIDPNVHVRRLSSEAIRTRLPWGQKLPIVLEYKPMVQKILTNLKDAPEKFVQKSVGNNINNLFKDDPVFAVHIITTWQKAKTLSPAAKWIIKHGSRNQK